MEEDLKVLEEFCAVFRMTQRTIDKSERDEYGEIIGQDEIQAIENLIARNKELEERDRANRKVIREYSECIPKSKVRELREIDNIDYLQFKIKELLQEGDK